MYPLGTTLLIAFSFGLLSFFTATNLFKHLWTSIATGIAFFVTIVISSAFNLENLQIGAVILFAVMVIIALIKNKITKG